MKKTIIILFFCTKIFMLSSFVLANQLAPITDSHINVFTCRPVAWAKYQEDRAQIKTLSIDDVIESMQTDIVPDKCFIQVINDKKNHNIDTMLYTSRGVQVDPNSPRITIYCRGYSRGNIPGFPEVVRKGGGIQRLYSYIKDGLLHAPCITFDTLSDSKEASFGQKRDLQCLEHVYNQIRDQAPHAQITLVGTCLGALTILEFLTTQRDNVDTVVLISPIFSARRVQKNLAYYYGNFFGFNCAKILYPLLVKPIFNQLFQLYDRNSDTLEDRLHTLTGKAIFIAHYIHDEFVSNDDVSFLIEKIKRNNEVYFFETDSTLASHADFSYIHEAINALNFFYQKHALPFNQHFAQQGEATFEKIRVPLQKV